MKKPLFVSYLVMAHQSIVAGVAGRKGVSDDQLLAFTVCLIALLLLIGFAKEIIAGIKQVWAKYFHKQSSH